MRLLSARRAPLRGAAFALLLLYGFALAAALTRLAALAWEPFDGGVKFPEMVPADAGTVHTVILVMAFAAAMAVLWLRPRGGWWLCLLVTLGVAVWALTHGVLPVFSLGYGVLLARRSVRAALAYNRTAPA